MAVTRELAPRRNWNMIKIISLLLLVVLGVGGVYYYQTHIAKGATTQPTTTSFTVANGNIFQAVASTGRVVSNLDVEIKCKAAGQIIELPYDVSQEVKKDALILQIDPIDQQRAVRQSEVELSQSQAKLAQSKHSLTIAEQTLVTSRDRIASTLKMVQTAAKDARDKAARRRNLFEQKLASPEELQAAETAATQASGELRNAEIAEQDLKTQELGLELKHQDIKLAEAQVEMDQITLSNAKQRLADTTVIAPMDGVVAQLSVQKGQIISSGITNVGGGAPAMILSDLSRIFVLASVDESDIGKVKLDQETDISADAFPGKRFKGKVVRIATKGVNVSNVVTFEVRVEVTSDNKNLLKPEMTANVQVISASKQDVLVVPANALMRKQGKMLATVEKQGGGTEERAVQVGLTDGEKYEVLAGLTEGEIVTVRKDEPQSKWREGGGARPPGMGVFPGGGGGGGRGGGGR
jgi:HlyD family secretion protein